MARRALLIAALMCSIGAASAAPIHLSEPSHTNTTRLSVRAGVAGLARPGRWMPVSIDVRAGSDGAVGTLRIEWGDAVVLRDVNVPAESTSHVEILVRAIAAGPVVRVTLGPVAEDAPVRLVSADEPLTLCIDATRDDCAASVSESELPSSARAFDLADLVWWPTPSSVAPAAARAAFQTWQAWREWSDSGAPDPVLPSIDTRSAIPSATAWTIFGSAFALAFSAGLAVWRRWPWPIGVVPPIIVTAAATWQIVYAGSAATVVINTAGVVHQFEGGPRAVVSLRGLVTHGRRGELTMAPALDDATLNASSTGTPRSLSTEDAGGRAIYRASAGLGASRRFTIDGSIGAAWLDVRADAATNPNAGNSLHVRNLAPFPLEHCEWRGIDRVPVGALAVNSEARLTVSAALATGDTLVCSLPADWLRWTTADARVATSGHEFLVFHVSPHPPASATDAVR